MPPFSRSDSLRLYLTGAAADGAAQSNPDLSLGHYRASTIAGSAPFILPDFPGLRVDYVSQANAIGAGSLFALDADTIAWSAPGDAAGTSVAIANGQTVLLESASGPDVFLVVTRTTADDLAGDASLEILQEHFNDAVAQANGSLPAPDKTYRCLMWKNGPGQVVKNLKIWLGSIDNPVRIALENPSAQPAGFVQTIADETTAPTGLTFVAPDSALHADVLTVATLRPNEQVALWLERDLSSASAAAIAGTGLAWSYTSIG